VGLAVLGWSRQRRRMASYRGRPASPRRCCS
jgi:hypothetical protein